MTFVEQVLRNQFENTFGIFISDFDYRVISSSSDPLSIDYTIDVEFVESSAFIPTKQEIDILTELVFLPPSDQDLIAFLGSQGIHNESTIESVSYTLDRTRDADVKVGVFDKELRKGEGAALVSLSLVAIFAALLYAFSRIRSPTTPRMKESHLGEDIASIMPSYSYLDDPYSPSPTRQKAWSLSSGWDGSSSSEEESLVSKDYSGRSANSWNRCSPDIRIREV